MFANALEVVPASTRSSRDCREDLSDLDLDRIRWADDDRRTYGPLRSVHRRSMLVGVDGTEASLAALRWAIDQTDRFGKLVSASAWQYPWWAVTPKANAPIARPEADFIRHAASRAASTMRRGGIVEREHLVLEGPTGPTLVAESAGVDLLVVGSRSRGPVAETFLGSVSGYCVANSRVPVAVVPSMQRRRSVRRVVVGLDRSAEAESALRWTVEHFGDVDDIDVVHVVADRALAYLDRKFDWLDRAVAEFAGSSGRRSPRIRGRIEWGDPADELRTAAVDADVLILGARGRGRLAHALVGSTTTALCRRPDVVTVVVPAGGA